MKIRTCKGCPWNSTGIDDEGNNIQYCISAPDHETPEEMKPFIIEERKVNYKSGPLYLVQDDDQCSVLFMRYI